MVILSRLYFHGIEYDSEICGTERHYASWVCKHLTLAFLSAFFAYPGMERNTLLDLVRSKENYGEILYEGKNFFEHNFENWFMNESNDGFLINGVFHSNFEIHLNTTLRLGNDQMKLYARLHGQCEIHCYVEHENMMWFSNIIENGLKNYIFRRDAGWENVISHLRHEFAEDRNEPIVTSFSVTDEFPNREICGISDWSLKDIDTWYDIPFEKRWQMGVRNLRAKDGGLMEIKPQNFNDYIFENGMDAFKLIDYIHQKIERAEGDSNPRSSD